MTQQPTSAGARPRGGGAAVIVALAVANGLGYLLTLVASRRLGPEGYGALAALLGVILVGNVLALALQAVIARRTVVSSGGSAHGWAGGLTLRCAVAVTGLGLVAAVPLTHLLHLDSPAPALLLAATLGPLTVVGGQLGVLQGNERWHALAQLYVIAGLGKVGGGVAGVLLHDSVTSAIAGTAAGALLAAIVGAALVRRPNDVSSRKLPAGVGRETMRATYTLGALFALANLDVVLARHFLPPRQAGLYAIGAVIAKGAFWLPSFVPVIAMPGLSDPARRRRTALVALVTVAATGAAVTAAAATMGSLIIRLIGGSAYVALADRAWLFAATGSLLAVVQLLLYSRLAGQDRRVAPPMWMLVALEVAVVAIWRHDSVTAIVTTAMGAALIAAALGVLAEAHEHGFLRARRIRTPARPATGP